ncbi:B3 domain-containing transcription factor ABI3 [Telopea speciosissima]|uniref:B3 domain-containing transcription factor ABI3 n=1 Tax=Telopea speciosissima TaxID=54955 RepID=UPI001CC3A89E|nr:B3 domain-containing transcription factor ABI3 [Telopea speciosissima]
MQMHDVDDLHGLTRLESVGDDQDPNFIPEEDDTDMWLDGDPRDLLDVDDSSIFYTDFPPLPDFPCISSSSSSSASLPTPAPEPAPVNVTVCRSSSSFSSSSSSSSVSWNILKSDAEGITVEEKIKDFCIDATVQQPSEQPSDSMENFPPQIDMDCIDVLQELGDMDLIDTNDMWDPNSMFPCENLVDDNQEQEQEQQQQHQQELQQQEQEEGPLDELPSEDLGMVFLDWLKSNKESISAEDLRSIKLKKSTIECAAQRLGGGKEGMKQLLKLILEWVQNHHLHKRRMQSVQHTALFRFPPMLGYIGDQAPFTHPVDYPNPMIDTAATWPPSPSLPPHFSLYNAYREQHFNPAPAPLQGLGSGGFGNQYTCHSQMVQGQEERLVKMGSSATKEARKKRMARQRRFLSHHRSQSHNHHQRQNSNSVDQHARLASDANCTTIASHANPGSGNWVFWPSTAAAATTTTVMSSDVAAAMTSDRSPLQPHHQRQVIPDRRQGWKQEKNWRFLLQKVLKQSDVGNLGRIVLPKKEAETHLPELEARDGISIAMEDIVTSRIWNMRYRFWPNNKSRMYLLENTGDFVRSNGLQEGDFIVIYSDIKSGKYMIRGVKVRQPGSKLEAKRGGKPQRNLHATSPSQAGDGGPSSSSPVKETLT